VTAIPYGIGVMGAAAANFRNASAWLALPFFGPWMTIGQRSYSCSNGPNQSTSDGLRCVGDVPEVMALIMDGVMQATGGTLILVGSLTTKQELSPGPAAPVAWTLAPMTVGSGAGVGALGVF
jgi:hypothetical protein